LSFDLPLRPIELGRLWYGPQVRAGITPQVQQVRRAQDHPHVVMLARGTRCQLQTVLPSVGGRRRQSAWMGWRRRPGVDGVPGSCRLKPIHVLARTGWTARVVTSRHAILRAGVRDRTLQPLDHQPLARQRCAELPVLLRQGSRRERATRAAPRVDCRSMHTLHAALCRPDASGGGTRWSTATYRRSIGRRTISVMNQKAIRLWGQAYRLRWYGDSLEKRRTTTTVRESAGRAGVVVPSSGPRHGEWCQFSICSPGPSSPGRMVWALG
jgi:hypothetical protein